MTDIRRNVEYDEQEKLHRKLAHEIEKAGKTILATIEKGNRDQARIDQINQRLEQQDRPDALENIDQQYEDFKQKVAIIADEPDGGKKAYSLQKLAQEEKVSMTVAKQVLAEVEQDKQEALINAQELDEARQNLLDLESDAREAGDEAALNGIQSALGEVDDVSTQQYNSPQREDDLDYDPQTTYQELSKQFEGDITIEKDASIAEFLIENGASRDFINAVISQSPELDNIRQLQTEEEAEKYLPLIVDDAYRQDFIKQNAELSPEVTKDRELEL